MSHPPPSHPHPLQPSAPSPPSPSPPSPSALICCNKPEVLWTWPTRPKEQIEVSSLQLHRGCEVGETWCGGAATEHWCADTLRLCGCCMEGRANTLMAIFILLLVWHYNTITLLTLQAFFFRLLLICRLLDNMVISNHSGTPTFETDMMWKQCQKDVSTLSLRDVVLYLLFSHLFTLSTMHTAVLLCWNTTTMSISFQ